MFLRIYPHIKIWIAISSEFFYWNVLQNEQQSTHKWCQSHKMTISIDISVQVLAFYEASKSLLQNLYKLLSYSLQYIYCQTSKLKFESHAKYLLF